MFAKITTIIPFLVLCKSMEWKLKEMDNILDLLNIGKTYVSSQYHELEYKYDLIEIYKITDHIREQTILIESNCNKKNDVICSLLVNELRLDMVRLIKNEIEFDNNSQNIKEQHKRTKVIKRNVEPANSVKNIMSLFHSETEKHEVLKKSKNVPYSDYIVNICTMSIMRHDRLLNAVKSLLKGDQNCNFFELIERDKIDADISKFLNKYNNTIKITTNPECESVYCNILEFSEIKAEVKDSILKMKIKIPILKQKMYNIYEIFPIPITVQQNSMILDVDDDKILIQNENETQIASKNNLKKINGKNLLTIQEIEQDKNSLCLIIMIVNGETNIENCSFTYIFNTNYIVKVSNNILHAKLIKPLIITETCANKTKRYAFSNSTILFIKPNCSVNIEDNIFKNNIHNNTISEFLSPNVQLNESELILKNSLDNYSLKYLRNTTILKIFRNKQDIKNLKYDINSVLKSIKIAEETEISFLHIIFSCTISIATSIILLIAVMILLYRKMFSINTWVKVTSKMIERLEKEK